MKCFGLTLSLCFIWGALLSPAWEDKVHPDLSDNIILLMCVLMHVCALYMIASVHACQHMQVCV